MSSSSKEPEANRDEIDDDDEAARRRDSRTRMLGFVRLADLARNRGFMPSPPPLEMFTHPDLLEKAWGWDRLLPYDYTIDEHGCCNPLYTRYLHQYCLRNSGLSLTKHCVSDLDSCVRMEAKLLSVLDQHRDLKLLSNEFDLSKKITDIVLKIDYANCYEFPTAPIALKCITKQAQLLSELIENGYGNAAVATSCSCLRKCILRFMTYKGTRDVIATASMMGIIKESGLMLEFLEKRLGYDDKGVVPRTSFVMAYAATILIRICPDTRGRNAWKSVPDKPDVKSCCDKINLQERKEVDQKTMNCSNKEPGQESHLEKGKEANQNKMVETSEKFSKEELLKRGSPKERREKNMTKELQLGGSNLISSSEKRSQNKPEKECECNRELDC